MRIWAGLYPRIQAWPSGLVSEQMNKRLWEISEEFDEARRALESMDADDETVEATLSAIDMEWRAKAVNVAAMIRHFEAEAAAGKARYDIFKADIDRIKAQSDANAARAKRLRLYLAAQMQRENIRRVDHDYGPPIVLSTGQSITLIDEAVPDEFVSLERKIDRAAAKRAATDGDIWAVFTDATTLRIG